MRPRPSHRWVATLLVAAAATACDNSVKPEPPSQDAELIRAAYVCGNDFDIESDSDTGMTVRYRVVGTSEAGDLSLPPRLNQTSPSTTRLTTLQTGELQLSLADTETTPRPIPPLEGVAA